MQAATIEKRLDYCVLPLIVLSVVLLAADAQQDADPRFGWVQYLEVALSVLFALEYATRLYLGGRRYAVSFFGVVDLLAIVPALVVQDALALRILRLLRIFTLFKLGRIGGAARRLGEALRTVKEEFLLVGVSAVTVLFVAAFGIRYFEQEAQPEAFSTYADCLWWAVSSLITGEYGDVSPVTTGGKAFATIILILSLAIIAAPAGLIASALSQTPREQARPDAEQRGT